MSLGGGVQTMGSRMSGLGMGLSTRQQLDVTVRGCLSLSDARYLVEGA